MKKKWYIVGVWERTRISIDSLYWVEVGSSATSNDAPKVMAEVVLARSSKGFCTALLVSRSDR